MKKIAIIVGHCAKEPGATSKTVGSEYPYNKGIASTLMDIADVFEYDNFAKGYSQTIKQDMYPKTKEYDLVLELHFNSFSNAMAQGVEALYFHGNLKAKAIANQFCLLMNAEFGSTIRGAKALKDASQRGYACVAYQRPTTLILEPFFCTASESIQFSTIEGKERYSRVLRELIQWYQKV